MKNTGLSRRAFLQMSTVAFFSGVVVTISACGKQRATETESSTQLDGVVSGNHGHLATVTAVQLTAARALTLSIRGTADHSHNVSLTAADMAKLAKGTRVVKTTTTGAGHTHTVTFN